jgi:hypothetical protein
MTSVLLKNYRRDLKRARLTNLKEETGTKRHPSMMKFCSLWLNLFGDLLHFLVLSLRSKSSLAAENLFLRKQLAFYQERKIKPRRTSHPARLALLWLSRWFNWRSALTVVTPKTFVGWHRKGFQLFWRRKCQSGRPRIPPELQHLIRKMARENLSWGEERIANELLLKLRLRVSPRTIRKYLPKSPAARDAIFSTGLDASLVHLGLEVIETPVRTPKANSLCERLIGTLRRECLDWMIPLTEEHLRKTLRSWLRHYNRGRPHSSLGPGLPDPPLNFRVHLQRQRHRFDRSSRVVAHPVLNGLHHEYSLLARAA